MKTKVMGSSVTSETVSQDTISIENIINAVEEHIQSKMPEIAKKVPRVPRKGTEQIDDRGIRKANYLPEGVGEKEDGQDKEHCTEKDG